jgi:plasmid replication initiation protein
MEAITLNLENITQANLDGASIRKHNDLIEAKYQLPNLQEQRLILMLLSQIKTADEDFKSYRITVADFAEFIGLKGKDVYAELDRTALALVSRTVSIRNGKSFLHVNWLSSAKYQSGSGYVELAFDPNLKPYLLQLKSHYTQYKLDMAIHFKSIYSIRLYELLKKEAFKERNGYFDVLFEYGQLREDFGIGKKEYLKFNNFKQKAIEPATREISDKTDLYINNVRYGKTGRKITNITFCVQIRTENETKLRQDNLRIEDIKPDKESATHPVIETLVSLGFSFEIAKAYKTKHGVKKIERNIAYTLAKKQEGLVKDVPAYINKAIENDYGGAWDIENQKKIEAKKEKDRLEKEAKEKEEKKVLASKEKYAMTLQRFYNLPDNSQIEIKQSFLVSIKENNLIVGQWKKAERENKSPLESIMIQKTFIKFLIDNNICGAE